jgi:GTP diphosphokinase / guanosine-3',5'-bis(diphosphate) 3'-diphosphatase
MALPSFLTELTSHFGENDTSNLSEAYKLAQEIYGNEQCVTGESLILSAEKVARLLLPFHPDAKTLTATFLQYVNDMEALKQIEERFGKDVRSTISSLAILDRWHDRTSSNSPAELHRMVTVLSSDVRVLLICLHNCLNTLEQAKHLNEKARILLARDVLEVFAPLCAKLGIYSLKYRLETLAFFILHSQDASEIDCTFETLRKKHGDFLSICHQSLKDSIKREGLNVAISARKKHPYSIFRKMNRKNITSMTDLYDLYGMRILVESIEDCYRLLGVIHSEYRPILHRIKDYIAMPKPNGYRSLHTTAMSVSQRSPKLPVEIQIRTYEMDEEAEYGIAAHWNYKEHGTTQPLKNKVWNKRIQSLQQITSSDDSSVPEITEDCIQEELSDRIFVMTPKGDPIELPKGATPLDFAFRIHTDIGLCFRSAKVNSVIAPIDQHLENGDMIEILRWKLPKPSEQWITALRTKEARQKLRGYFQKEPSKKKAIGQR